EHIARKYYQPCQTGPVIYDSSGELVWSGACLFRNRNAHDFRPYRANGTDYLSAILWKWDDVFEFKGQGVLLNNSFDIVATIDVPSTMQYMNMHELKMLDDGKKAIYITPRTQIFDFEAQGLDLDADVGFLADQGFHERDLVTGEVLFEWWASDHIPLNESSAEISDLTGPWPAGWSWIHMNSVDKNADGDYMISARYTNAIYKISGQDGSVLWTLGGPNSVFELESGFNFSRQHDARFFSQTADTEVITFMDNGGDGPYSTSDHSSSLVVSLDKAAMVANVTRRWIRPDGQVTMARGNFQTLPNGNAFTGWSENCKITEHSWDGKLLMEAQFSDYRFVTYRTWKANFTGVPSEPPDLRAFVYGTGPETSTTVFYVSWNGATEVARWDFYRVVDAEEHLIGSEAKAGFETIFQSTGYERTVFVEGVAADGSPLGRSTMHLPMVMGRWNERSASETLNPTEAMDSEAEVVLAPQQSLDFLSSPEQLTHGEMSYADTQSQVGSVVREKTEL
ncbi:hypothetical protein B0A55_02224, partial [Friedmanniomyces simplex]